MITEEKMEQIRNEAMADGIHPSQIREYIEYHSERNGGNYCILITDPIEDCDPREHEFEDDYTEEEFAELCRCYDENEMVGYTTYVIETLKYVDSSASFYDTECAVITAKEMADFYEN